MTYPGLQKYFESRWQELATVLGPKSNPDPKGDYLLAPASVQPNSELRPMSTTEPGLHHVSLRLMHDRARAVIRAARSVWHGPKDHANTTVSTVQPSPQPKEGGALDFTASPQTLGQLLSDFPRP